MKVFLDTHAAVALYEGNRKTFGRQSTRLAERSVLFVSPVVELELRFLAEIARIRVSPEDILGGLVVDWGLTVSDDPMQEVVRSALPLSWTHDPFDRLLVATAMLHGAPFITRDQRIHEHFADAVW